jgi:mannose-6-phosphate isomerase-like protein (cupin superfamily)
MTRSISPEQMQSRVARFGDLKPSKMAFVDHIFPECHRDIFDVIGKGVTEDASHQAAITPAEDFHLTYAGCAPGHGAGLHSHTTVEVFVPMTGEWEITWGDEGENSVVLGPLDVIAVPTDVMRAFKNISSEYAILMAIQGGTDPGKLEWSRKVKEALARNAATATAS